MDIRRYKNALIALAVIIFAAAALYFVSARAGRSASEPAGAEALVPSASASEAPTEEPTETAAPKPTPAPTPAAVPEPSAFSGPEQAVRSFFSADVGFDTGLVFNRNEPFADEIESKKQQLLSLESRLTASAENKLASAAAEAAESLGTELNAPMLEAEFPSWQLVAAVCWACGTEKGEKLISDTADVAVSYDGRFITARLVFGSFDEIVSAAEPDERFTADFVYSYFRTVFDEEFEPVEYKMPRLSDEYVSTIAFPLAKMSFYDSWYGPRQQSTRYHLGMDIHAAADTPIFSCTDGEVTAIGYDDIAGNYVVIRDRFGYEYHYYHMIRLTELFAVGDSIERGRQIGNVGCTGNSDANHLHISIITPDHVHLNPYYVMLDVKRRG